MLSDRLRFQDIRRTSTFRLTVLLSVVFAGGMIALLGLIYGLTARELTDRSDRILRQEADRLLSVPPGALPNRIAEEIARQPNGLTYLSLISGTGEQIVGNILLGSRLHPCLGQPVEVDRVPGGVPMRLMAIRTPLGETILIGRDVSQIRDLRSRILVIVVVAGLATIIIMALAAIALSLQPLQRVRRLQQASRAIASGRLDVRMPIAGRHDELDQFAATVNVMVDDVARVVAQVKNVTDAIAHDLRTPLMRVRAHLYRTQNLVGATPGVTQLAEHAVTELDSVLERFAAILRIGEIEASARRAAFDPVELHELLEEICSLYEPLAEQSGLALRVVATAAVTINADRTLLVEALSNLVDNALKFTRSEVLLDLCQRAGEVTVEVRDDGRGIRVGERDMVLLPFQRGNGTAGVPGFGLGLGIVNAILHLHGFILELDDAHPGLIARIRIPAQDRVVA